MSPALPSDALPIRLRMTLAAARVLGTTWRDWHVPGGRRLTPTHPAATVPASLTTDAGETGPRSPLPRPAPAPKGNRPGNSQAKGPHRIGLSGE
jgi:hypothetical protein